MGCIGLDELQGKTEPLDGLQSHNQGVGKAAAFYQLVYKLAALQALEGVE